MTGYKGRLGIYEIMEMTEELKSLIMAKANASNIRDKAIEQGMTTMIEDGINKALAGVTTIEEVLRVTRE
jgi:type II secretory ATPase GspE/PulE/Tfp pilus assembly ATPase PilB-like protein